MTPSTNEQRDRRMWGEFWILWAAKRRPSLRTEAMSSPSMNTIVNVMLGADAALDHDDREALALKHQTIMFKAGAGLGLK